MVLYWRKQHSLHGTAIYYHTTVCLNEIPETQKQQFSYSIPMNVLRLQLDFSVLMYSSKKNLNAVLKQIFNNLGIKEKLLYKNISPSVPACWISFLQCLNVYTIHEI